jgi:hypothetical protein
LHCIAGQRPFIRAIPVVTLLPAGSFSGKVIRMASTTAALRRPGRAAIVVALILAAALVAMVAATTVRAGGGSAGPQAAYSHPRGLSHALADSTASPDIYYHA